MLCAWSRCSFAGASTADAVAATATQPRLFLYNLAVAGELKDRGVDEWVPDGRFLWLGLATLVVTVTLAAVSYYLVERPLLRRKPYRRPAS